MLILHKTSVRRTHQRRSCRVRSLVFLFIVTIMLYSAVPSHAQRASERARIVAEIEETDRRTDESLRDWLMEHRVPRRVHQPNGRVVELIGVRDGHPIYLTPVNSTAARATGTSYLYPGDRLGLSLTGAGVEMGIWDSGHVLSDHQELAGRTTAGDESEVSDHATHVAGTLIARGIDPRARGMAYEADLTSYSWTADATEMSNEASQGMLISNHSYSIISGWHYGDLEDEGQKWYWLGDPTISTSEDYMFGRYDVSAVQFDRVAFTHPYFLPVVAAGNDRMDVGPSSGSYRAVDEDGDYQTYFVESRPIARDGGSDGFDTLAGSGVAKNVLTVGSIAFYEADGRSQTSSFSSFGPTDDSRIKPDVMGLGESIFSLSADGPQAYAYSSGTSMATPNVAGSLALLQQHYREIYGTYMRAATLKGLVIHTAADLDAPGPDFRTGWGLLDAEAAAEQITSSAMNAVAIAEETLEDGEIYQRDLSADAAGPLQITLSWTDRPGSRLGRNPSSLDDPTPQLLNDLDLRVVHVESGMEYLPFAPDGGDPAQAAPRGDNVVDPVEHVYIADAEPGDYVVAVSHKDGLYGGAPQDFSLIVSGADEEAAPVAVAHVSAEASLDGVTLRWSTLFQRDIGSFEVERGPATTPKSDDSDFVIVGATEVSGDSGRPYELVDDWSVAGHYLYRIVYTNAGERYVAAETEVTIVPPESYEILSSYPNPFRDRTELIIDLPKTQLVSLTVYDALGRQIVTIPEAEMPAGRHTLALDGANWPAGVYFARVSTPNGVVVHQIVRQ